MIHVIDAMEKQNWQQASLSIVESDCGLSRHCVLVNETGSLGINRDLSIITMP